MFGMYEAEFFSTLHRNRSGIHMQSQQGRQEDQKLKVILRRIAWAIWDPLEKSTNG